VKFLCDQCKAKYQVPDDKAAGKTVRMKCRKCGFMIEVVTTSLATAPRPQTAPKDDEVSASFDLDDLAIADWYVAINGVPVGPIRVGDIRRKAAAGTVNEASLAWQEGLEEWRPLRAFPELMEAVRDSIATARTSVLGAAADDVTQADAIVAPPFRPRVPRQWKAARKADEPSASHDFSQAVLAQPASESLSRTSIEIPKRPTPWIPIAMVVLAAAFGVTAALVVFFRPATPQSVGSRLPPQAPAPNDTVDSPPVAHERGQETTSASASRPTTTVAITMAATPLAASAARPPSGGGLDLSELGGSHRTSLPEDEPAGGSAGRSSESCFSQGQILAVVNQYQTAVKRACWDRAAGSLDSVSVQVSLTIGPGGDVQSVAASGEPTVARCVEASVRAWRFPAMGCVQRTAFSYKFVRQ
jgi:predicted Zn finger-like uncharacterized protein